MLYILKADQRKICNICSRLDSGVLNLSKPLQFKPRWEIEKKNGHALLRGHTNEMKGSF